MAGRAEVGDTWQQHEAAPPLAYWELPPEIFDCGETADPWEASLGEAKLREVVPCEGLHGVPVGGAETNVESWDAALEGLEDHFLEDPDASSVYRRRSQGILPPAKRQRRLWAEENSNGTEIQLMEIEPSSQETLPRGTKRAVAANRAPRPKRQTLGSPKGRTKGAREGNPLAPTTPPIIRKRPKELNAITPPSKQGSPRSHIVYPFLSVRQDIDSRCSLQEALQTINSHIESSAKRHHEAMHAHARTHPHPHVEEEEEDGHGPHLVKSTRQHPIKERTKIPTGGDGAIIILKS